jgi:hypothetical protein
MKLPSLPVTPTALPPALVDQIDNLLVDLTAKDHLHQIHGLGVGDAHALDEFALLADAFEQVFDLRAAAMHHHRVQADQLEQDHVAGERRFQDWVGHGVAAVFDDHGLVPETLDIGQGFGDDLGLVGGGELRDGHGRFRVR